MHWLLLLLAVAVRADQVALTIAGQGAALPAAPVVVPLGDLQALVPETPIALGSLRVVGPAGELPSQVEEWDGTGNPVANPNHTLDPDDLLVFQVDVPAAGEVVCHISWGYRPTPPATYPQPAEIREITEPDFFGGDLLLRQGQNLLVVKGPARGEDPTQNQRDNWGNGALLYCRLLGKPVVQGGWANLVPKGSPGSNPGPDAAAWSLPTPLVRGPARVGVSTALPEFHWPAGDAGEAVAGLQRRIWLYGRGAWVRVDDGIALPEGSPGELNIGYAMEMRRGRAGDRIHYSVSGEARTFAPTPEQEAEGDAGKVVFSAGDLDGWMASEGDDAWANFVFVADIAPPLPGESDRVDAYSRTGAVWRWVRRLPPLPPESRLDTHFWLVAIPPGAPPEFGLAAWRYLTQRPWRLGTIERGER